MLDRAPRFPHAVVPALEEGGAGRRTWLAVRIVIGFLLLQLAIGIVVGVGMGIVLVVRGATSMERLTAQLGELSPIMLSMLALIELGVLAFALLRASGHGLDRVGLTWDGADRSLVQLAPLLVVLGVVFWLDPGVSMQAALESPVLPLVIVFACLVGLTEELVFRGLLVGVLGGSSAPLLAVLGSATLFAVVHFAAPTGDLHANPLLVMFTIFALFGVPFAVVYLRSGSIVVLAIAHAGWDVLVLASQGLESPASSGGALEWLVPGAVAAAYGTWFIATSEQGLRMPRLPERSSVDWDELAEDDILNPWVQAQLRRAAAE